MVSKEYEILKNLLSFLTIKGRPALVEEKDFRRYVIVSLLSIFALIVHLFLIYIFWLIGAIELSVINVGSVLIWTAGLYINIKGKHDLAILLLCLEVMLHAVLATSYLGLGAGFQHYLWAIAALAVLNTRLNTLFAGLFSFLFIMIFAYLYLIFSEVQYSYRFAQWLEWVHFANILVAGLPFIIALVAIRFITVVQEARLSELASVDSLTGLYNRRFATDAADKVLKRAARLNEPVSIVIGDIDFFKEVNDRAGHEVGDAVLKRTGLFLREQFREEDVVARWGGEEFLIVLPGMTGDTAFRKIESVREQFVDKFEEDNPLNLITMSFGVTECQPGSVFKDSLRVADHAMYASKEKGRNCTTLFPLEGR